MKTINVNTKSLKEFFKTNAIEFKEGERENYRSHDTSAYHLMQDDIYLRKNADLKDLEPSCNVVFRLSDIGAQSQRKLVNTYTYRVELYDDISFKLELIDFKVELEDKPQTVDC